MHVVPSRTNVPVHGALKRSGGRPCPRRRSTRSTRSRTGTFQFASEKSLALNAMGAQHVAGMQQRAQSG
ncbi:MAG: hypothetical protein DMG02_06155 [Acidobacteria bacterium]|nr:MAG: hypothetical protein DMG03_06925 [Acidobacteriota bacterium]PYQ91564.1 MAG: hypothetical protein DMG02_06155 [Acidobacteriota bacterium]